KAAKVKEAKEAYPLKDKEAPVALEILYDGKPVPFELKGGKAVIKEPRQGTKVTFVLKRKDNSKTAYGVVLKINGENTLFHERLPDLQCHKWILEPGCNPMTIRGFQNTDRSAEEFKVLSAEESKQNEMNYASDVGTVSVTVFRDKQGP